MTALRDRVIAAINPDTFEYYSTEAHKVNHFIDGMAWCGVMCGAARLVDDWDVSLLYENFLRRLLMVAPKSDARAFTKTPPEGDDKWVKSTTLDGFYILREAQSFAGPAGLEFAIQCGAPLRSPFNVEWKAQICVWLGGLYGRLYKRCEWLHQHASSVWLAHLILKAKPAPSLAWMAAENPFFSYIAKMPCRVKYPGSQKYINGESEVCDHVMPFADAKPCTWPFRRNPFKRYYDASGAGVAAKSYTPVAELAGTYLQDHLERVL